jgi:NADH-quinone oxidoreductase subunit E
MNKNDIINKYNPTNDNIILILHELQNYNPQNYLQEEDLKMVADYLNTTLSSVFGVANYYSMFSLKPRGRYIIRVCETHICNIANETSVMNSLKKILNINVNETTPDGLFTLETSECLGHCGEPSVMMINKDVYTNVTPENVKDIINKIRNESQDG